MMQLKKMLAIILISFICLLQFGCVSRELVITSEPEGAKVLINDTYTGTTPMTHKFVHYQVFGIRIEKEGFHPIYVEEKVSAPLYEKPGIDFVSEALLPKKINDRRTFHYKLAKIEKVDELNDVLGAAQKVRAKIAAVAKEDLKKDAARKHLDFPLPLKKRVKEAEAAKKTATVKKEASSPKKKISKDKKAAEKPVEK